MEYGTSEMIAAVNNAEIGFLKHIDGVTNEQAVWKPYPGCKSIAETIDHLIWGENAVVEYAKTGQEPDYTTVPEAPPTDSLDTLKAKLSEAHSAMMSFFESQYASGPLTAPVRFYGREMPIGEALGACLTEFGYHTGQVAFVRMAVDPSWDYYTAIYS